MIISGYFGDSLPELDDFLGGASGSVVGVRGGAKTTPNLTHVSAETLHSSQENTQVLHRPAGITNTYEKKTVLPNKVYTYHCLTLTSS